MNTAQHRRHPFGPIAIIVALSVAAVSWTPSSILAQGAPPHVRKAVDAVIAMLQSSNTTGLRTFIDNHMVDVDPAAVDDLIAELTDVREAVRGLDGDLAVEGEPGGVRLILAGGGARKQIRVRLDQRGISAIMLVADRASALNTNNRDAVVMSHIRALEDSAFGEFATVVSDFETNRFSREFKSSKSSAERRDLLKKIEIAASQDGDALLDERNGKIVLTLAGAKTYEITLTVESGPPYRITSLDISGNPQPAPTINLTLDNLSSKLTELESAGFSGAVSVQIDGRMVHQKAYGPADSQTGRRNTFDTIFGVGSRPIDFTVAAILLLEHRGQLSRDDRVSKHFPDVPGDKRAMTVRHLMTGGSGLPDFHGVPSDWDQDLAWIDRDTAMRRILAQPLLFKPGQDNRHSHSAFGVLAALVEVRSGQSYYSFIRENFLDPAGMRRTGEYGESRGLKRSDFAAGGGPSFVGLPNIPPNWGPTSWLVKGSGGMYSTAGDLIKFYELVRGDKVPRKIADHFKREVIHVDGSDRGFELFSHHDEDGDDQVFLFLNSREPDGIFRSLRRALSGLVQAH